MASFLCADCFSLENPKHRWLRHCQYSNDMIHHSALL
jgi:hypothetical protein